MEQIITLAEIQALIKAPKDKRNDFGKYQYRSAEDILEAVKPIVNPLGFWITLNDSIEVIGGRFYVVATVALSNGKEVYTSTACAREDEIIKGMASSQITGSCSSYARKYALSGLFAIDNTKDADATNEHKKDQDEIGDDARDFLISLLETSTYEERQRTGMKLKIDSLKTSAEFEKAKKILEDNQLGIDGIINPSQKDINNHIKKLA